MPIDARIALGAQAPQIQLPDFQNLALQRAQMMNYFSEVATRNRALTEQQNLAAVTSQPGFDPLNNPEHKAALQRAAPNLWQPYVKNLYENETAKLAQEKAGLENQKLQVIAGLQHLQTFDKPQDALDSIARSQMPEDQKTAHIQQIPMDPEGFKKWKKDRQDQLTELLDPGALMKDATARRGQDRSYDSSTENNKRDVAASVGNNIRTVTEAAATADKNRVADMAKTLADRNKLVFSKDAGGFVDDSGNVFTGRFSTQAPPDNNPANILNNMLQPGVQTPLVGNFLAKLANSPGGQQQAIAQLAQQIQAPPVSQPAPGWIARAANGQPSPMVQAPPPQANAPYGATPAPLAGAPGTTPPPGLVSPQTPASTPDLKASNLEGLDGLAPHVAQTAITARQVLKDVGAGGDGKRLDDLEKLIKDAPNGMLSNSMTQVSQFFGQNSKKGKALAELNVIGNNLLLEASANGRISQGQSDFEDKILRSSTAAINDENATVFQKLSAVKQLVKMMRMRAHLPGYDTNTGEAVGSAAARPDDVNQILSGYGIK